MNANPRVLVVAPDAELRRSIVFALEAEGLHVILRDELPAPSFILAPEGLVYAVVDESAVLTAPDGWARLAALPCRTVLLVDRMHAMPPADFAGIVVRKPLLGRSLVEPILASLPALEQERTTWFPVGT
jgi:hypothetical protein